MRTELHKTLDTTRHGDRFLDYHSFPALAATTRFGCRFAIHATLGKGANPPLPGVVAEMIRTELGAARNLRVVPEEDISHMAAEFSFPLAASLDQLTLRQVRHPLDAADEASSLALSPFSLLAVFQPATIHFLDRWVNP